MFQNEPTATEVVCARMHQRKLSSLGEFGDVENTVLENLRKVNAIWYLVVCFPKVITEVKIESAMSQSLHNDNVNSNTTIQTTKVLKQEKFNVMFIAIARV